MNTKHVKTTMLFVAAVIIFAFTSCSRVNYGYLKGDVIGFSQNVVTSYDAENGMLKNNKNQKAAYNLNTNEGKNAMIQFIDNEIPRGSNTSAYYAMELACDRIKYIRRHETGSDRYTKYYIFLLTDGLDNSSAQAAKNAGQHFIPVKTEDYPDYLQKKLRKVMGWTSNTFEVYPMLYEGDDIKRIMTENNLDRKSYEEYLRSKFECFRYSSTGNPPALVFADDFKKIFSEMRERFISSSYEFRIPKSYAGRRIRMKFISNQGKVAELTGDFKKNLFNYTLENIQVNGMTINIKDSQFSIREGTGIQAISQQDSTKSNVFFRIEELKCDGKAFVVGDGPNDVTQYYKDDNLWIVNSEYNTENFVNIDTYFIIVIDGSKSLDGPNGNSNGFSAEKKMAKDIIEMVSKPNR